MHSAYRQLSTYFHVLCGSFLIDSVYEVGEINLKNHVRCIAKVQSNLPINLIIQDYATEEIGITEIMTRAKRVL